MKNKKITRFVVYFLYQWLGLLMAGLDHFLHVTYSFTCKIIYKNRSITSILLL
jgi:hypothetical protein